jgi:hypothetical protein
MNFGSDTMRANDNFSDKENDFAKTKKVASKPFCNGKELLL